MDIRKTRTECYLRNPKSTFELHILLSADRNRQQAFDWTIIRVIIEHIITLAPYCPVTLYHRWPGVQDGKVGSMSPLPKLRPRVVYFQAAARNPPTTSLARLRIWPFPCPSTQMPELATVSPGWQPWWQRPSAEALRAPPSSPQGCRHPHSQCCRCLCDAAGRRWFLAVEAISGIPGVEPKCTA